MSRFQSVYDKVPYVVQSFLLNLYALGIHRERYGKPFTLAFDELQKTQWFSPDQIHQYQNEKLQVLVRHAYDTVPFYRKRFDEHGVRPEDIKTLCDISRLPILTREDVRSAGDTLISSRYSKSKLIHGHTSGTTGSPLSCYWDKQTCVYNNAADWRQKMWAGLQYGDGIALFLGRTIVPTNKTSPLYGNMIVSTTCFGCHLFT